MRDEFKMPYARPQRFSDPSHEWTGPEGPAAILAKQDSQLEWSDFTNIFHWENPIGTYEEIVYFLPIALEYLLVKPQEGLECDGEVVYFVSHNKDRLQKEGLLEPARRKLQECLLGPTASFRVGDYDSVEGSNIFFSLVQALVQYESHADLAIEALESLAQQKDDPVKSAWFLEFARSFTELLDFESRPEIRAAFQAQVIEHAKKMGTDPDVLDSINEALDSVDQHQPRILRYAPIRTLVEDHWLLEFHGSAVVNSTLFAECPSTYWDALFDALGI